MLNLIFGSGDMKNKLVRIILLVIAICLMNNRFFAQPSGIPLLKAQMALFTDRNLYLTGEDIRFSVFPVSNYICDDNKASRIIYVEIITPDGNKIVGGKYLLENGKSQGCITIPENTLTGDYYIRAYTKYMRNLGPSIYPSVGMKLINPAKNNVLTGNGYSGDESVDSLVPGNVIQDIMAIIGDKNLYATRENVNLHIQTKRLTVFESTGWCLTVVPDGTLDELKGAAFTGTLSGNLIKDSAGFQFYPDTRGISISGKLVDKETGKSISDGVVTLSIIGDKDFSAYKTGQGGQFYFSLPDYCGRRDIFLSSSGISDTTTGLLIDNDFCTNPVMMPSTVFMLTEKERQAGLTIAVNEQIKRNYQNNIKTVGDSVSGIFKSFYGEPSETLILDKYVQLPTLEEYFNELPMVVKIRERKGRKYFKFLSVNSDIMLYDPLILVDWVVVSEIDKILAVSPQKISRIEIVNRPYVKGNLTYGGILSIISRQGDFAGINLPASGVFINYAFLSDECRDIRYGPVSESVPDCRNTLFWEPDLIMNSGDSQLISFFTSDTPGNYLIVLRGVGINGEIYQQTVRFKVE